MTIDEQAIELNFSSMDNGELEELQQDHLQGDTGWLERTKIDYDLIYRDLQDEHLQDLYSEQMSEFRERYSMREEDLQ